MHAPILYASFLENRLIKAFIAGAAWADTQSAKQTYEHKRKASEYFDGQNELTIRQVEVLFGLKSASLHSWRSNHRLTRNRP